MTALQHERLSGDDGVKAFETMEMNLWSRGVVERRETVVRVGFSRWS